MAYAQALSDWAEARGYEAETLWDVCTVAALGMPYEKAQWRGVRTLSGGEQKRLVLEALLRGTDEVLLLDEPDNYLDVPGKQWLEEQLLATRKTVLFVSHDRELLARAAQRIVTVEPGPAGSDTWVHGGGFATYHEAREQRFESPGAGPGRLRRHRAGGDARPLVRPVLRPLPGLLELADPVADR
jgi:ATPase subunit of ABC transporter with duplicated ATPase domains